MKIHQLVLVLFFMSVTACIADYNPICSICTYQRPDNNSIVQARKCEAEEDEILLTEWEEDFKTQVRALGGEWDSLEITCVREPL